MTTRSGTSRPFWSPSSVSRSAAVADGGQPLAVRRLTRVAVLLAGFRVLRASPLTGVRSAGPAAAGSASAAEATVRVSPGFRPSVPALLPISACVAAPP